MKITQAGSKNLIAIATLSSVLALTGCAGGPGGAGVTNDQMGAIGGSIIGAAIGNNMGKGRGRDVMRVAGALVGGMIGAQMTAGNRQRVYSTLDSTPNYQAASWNDQSTNSKYTVTPVSTYQANVNGAQATCREYKMNAWIDGRAQTVNGRACKDASGQWVAAS